MLKSYLKKTKNINTTKELRNNKGARADINSISNGKF